MKKMFAAALWLIASQAGASGDFGPSYTMFKAYRAPDIPLVRFQSGELGVLQPGMRRVYLYTAWRAISLGPRIADIPGTQGGLARADGSAFGNGWYEASSASLQPLRPRLADLLRVPENDDQVRKLTACPEAASAYAMRTFQQASTRADATPQRLDQWLLAQHRVGEACREAEDARYRYDKSAAPLLAAPAPLPESEPLFWRQLREYQRAAWHFHLNHYAESATLFERIGASRGHPMQGLGRYLALRAEVRDAVAQSQGVDAAAREQKARGLENKGGVILSDASLAAMHEPVHALLRAMRVGLTPESRLAELSRYLDNPAADPFALDRLGDWSVLMDVPQAQQLRSGHEFIDWIETLQECDRTERTGNCSAQARHALDRWRQRQSRTWLMAALMLAESMPAELERAALAIPAADPAFLTARYHVARLIRLSGRSAEARALLDPILTRQLPAGTRNLFREERFASASSVRDAAAYLLRTNVDFRKMREDEPENSVNDDGLRWVNEVLTVADLIELAGSPALPREMRARIAGAAWMRAVLIGKPQLGQRAADLLAQLAPVASDAVARYRRSASPAEARHRMLVETTRLGLSAQLAMSASPIAAGSPDDVTASAWCSFHPDATGGLPSFPWRLPEPPPGSNSSDAVDEFAALRKLKTATGVLGDDVMQWSVSQPADPELPWLLHVVVQSTRGGCLDPDAKSLSKRAFTLLHKRYPRSEWARKTPYFY